MMRRRVLSLVAAMGIVCACRSGFGQPVFPLHTSGRFIVDHNGARVRLNGVNWYGAESSDFVVAGLETARLQSIVAQIKDLGFNVVRLPWSNQLYESNPVVGDEALAANPELKGEHALTILDRVISALTNAGIMVILDNHNSDAEWCCSTTDGNSLWYNSAYPQTSWIADWRGMARRYQNNPLVIGADLRNEPRAPATWGGSASTDWHAAAELGGDAVLSINPHWLIFVEGINYALDLSGARRLPVKLRVPHQLVYEAHNYGFDYGHIAGYSGFVAAITPKWGYLVIGKDPQPLWIGEFGTCNGADTCVDSNRPRASGYWFNLLTAYMGQFGVDWTYWAINGTQSTGKTRRYGAQESFGILNDTWSGSASAALTTRLQSMMSNAAPGITLVGDGGPIADGPHASGTTQVAIVPENGFTGAVKLTCVVSGRGEAKKLPACSVPSGQSIAGNAAVSFAVSIKNAGTATQGGAKGGGASDSGIAASKYTVAVTASGSGGVSSTVTIRLKVR